jgi:hypothetical protein
MAQGDLIIFSRFKVDLGLSLHDLNTDEIRVAFITSVQTPAANSLDPRWGAAGTVNFLTDETFGGNFPEDGEDIANSYVANGADALFDGTTNIAYAKNASNPSAARWAIIYNFADTGKRCIAAVDLGADADGTAGAVNVTWNTSGIFTVA